MPETPVSVLAINCSPSVGGRTRTALEGVLAGARETGATTDLIELAGAASIGNVADGLDAADAFVFGSPMYRATFAWPFKELVDHVPRAMYGEERAPLTGRATLTVATAASDHHFLGPAGMRDILVDFFAAHVVSPGLYVPDAGFDEAKELVPEVAARAALLGRAVVELALAIRSSDALGAVEPNA